MAEENANQPHCAFPHFFRIPFSRSHDTILSNFQVSVKPGAVQYVLAEQLAGQIGITWVKPFPYVSVVGISETLYGLTLSVDNDLDPENSYELNSGIGWRPLVRLGFEHGRWMAVLSQAYSLASRTGSLGVGSGVMISERESLFASSTIGNLGSNARLTNVEISVSLSRLIGGLLGRNYQSLDREFDIQPTVGFFHPGPVDSIQDLYSGGIVYGTFNIKIFDNYAEGAFIGARFRAVFQKSRDGNGGVFLSMALGGNSTAPQPHIDYSVAYEEGFNTYHTRYGHQFTSISRIDVQNNWFWPESRDEMAD